MLYRVIQARGSTPMVAHISWNCRRNWEFFRISCLCLLANSSKWVLNVSNCLDIWRKCSGLWAGTDGIPLIRNNRLLLELLCLRPCCCVSSLPVQSDLQPELCLFLCTWPEWVKVHWLGFWWNKAQLFTCFIFPRRKRVQLYDIINQSNQSWHHGNLPPKPDACEFVLASPSGDPKNCRWSHRQTRTWEFLSQPLPKARFDKVRGFGLWWNKNCSSPYLKM